MYFSLTVSLSYNDKGLFNNHTFTFDCNLHNLSAEKLEEILKSPEIRGLKDAINALSAIIKNLKCSFTVDVNTRVDGKEDYVCIDFKLIPSVVEIRRKGEKEGMQYTTIKDGKEKVLTVLRKEVKKAKEQYKKAALQALVEKAKKAEAK